MMKIYIFVIHRRRIFELSNLFHEIYFRNMSKTHCRDILEKFVGYSRVAFKFFKCLYFAVGCFFLFTPIAMGLLMKERLLPFGLFLPYFDAKSSPGFEVNYFYICLLVVLALPGFTSSDSYFVSNIFLGMGHLDMMIALLDDLNELLGVEQRPMERSSKLELKIEHQLRQIVIEHQVHNKSGWRWMW